MFMVESRFSAISRFSRFSIMTLPSVSQKMDNHAGLRAGRGPALMDLAHIQLGEKPPAGVVHVDAVTRAKTILRDIRPEVGIRNVLERLVRGERDDVMANSKFGELDLPRRQRPHRPARTAASTIGRRCRRLVFAHGYR
jgi:hypothetical protein